MKKIINSLTNFLDMRLKTYEDVEQFLDNLEDEIFGVSNRDFYLKYKGDVKELLDVSASNQKDLSFESVLLAALLAYCNQRKANLT